MMKCRIFFIFLIASICFVACVQCTYGVEGIKAEQDHGDEREGLFTGYLYFIDKDGRYLKSVEKKLAEGLNAHALGIEIIKALIRGPSLEGIKGTIPKETKINALFILDDGTAYIDFEQNINTLKDYSVQSEMLAVYSIVNSLILNVEEIKRVKILIRGETAQTLSGHIDLDCFYEANMLIVK